MHKISFKNIFRLANLSIVRQAKMGIMNIYFIPKAIDAYNRKYLISKYSKPVIDLNTGILAFLQN